MAEPFLGEIRAIGFNFVPRGWAACEGSLLAISQNTALFSLLGTQFGGNGRTNFALPDARGRVFIGSGQAALGSAYSVGQAGGTETVTLSTDNLPPHRHDLRGSTTVGSERTPQGNVFATPNVHPRIRRLYRAAAPNAAKTQAITPTGQTAPHNNMMPYTAVNLVICLSGIFPPRQ